MPERGDIDDHGHEEGAAGVFECETEVSTGGDSDLFIIFDSSSP